MPVYAVIRKADQVEVYRYEAASAEEGSHPFSAHEHLALSFAAATTKRITRLAFLSRFTDAEAVAIDFASQGATVPAASMRRYLQKVNAAEHIDLSREETRAGVLALEAGGALQSGRAAAILDAPARAHEIYDREFLGLPAYSIPEPLPVGMATIYRTGNGFVTVVDGQGTGPAGASASWRATALQAKLIELGAEIRQAGSGVEIVYVAEIE